jgi:flagellar biosynthesis protein FlhB
MSEEETQDKENKTEEPSQKKLEEALEKGQVYPI